MRLSDAVKQDACLALRQLWAQMTQPIPSRLTVADE